MVEATLALAGASTLMVACVYGYVGARLSRNTSGRAPSSRAMRSLGFWWLATSVNQILGSALYLAYAFGHSDLSVQLTYVFVQRLLLAVSLVALMYYLLYLQTGKGYLVPLIAVYAIYFLSAVYTLTARVPVAVKSFGWRTDIVWAGELPEIWSAFALLLVVPPTIGALGMLRLYRRVDGPTRRFRIAMIGVGFVAWWVVALVAGQPRTFEIGWFQALNRVVGLAVAIGILLAYEPLPWMRRRFHLEPYTSPGS